MQVRILLPQPIFFGAVVQFGLRHSPVTRDLTGSNPVGTANFQFAFSSVAERPAVNRVMLVRFQQGEPFSTGRKCYASTSDSKPEGGC